MGRGRGGMVAARRNASRSARNVGGTYNEDALGEQSRPVYLDWRGCGATFACLFGAALSSYVRLARSEAGQDPTESGTDYRARTEGASASSQPRKRRRRG